MAKEVAVSHTHAETQHIDVGNNAAHDPSYPVADDVGEDGLSSASRAHSGGMSLKLSRNTFSTGFPG
jgi:hypothetical protein